jgi:hypothetical protein
VERDAGSASWCLMKAQRPRNGLVRHPARLSLPTRPRAEMWFRCAPQAATPPRCATRSQGRGRLRRGSTERQLVVGEVQCTILGFLRGLVWTLRKAGIDPARAAAIKKSLMRCVKGCTSSAGAFALASMVASTHACGILGGVQSLKSTFMMADR